jgi:hypothetical protein
VTHIIFESFFNNDILTEVISNARVPPVISNTAFGPEPRSRIDLTVPEGTEQAYLDAGGGWTGFRTINGVFSEFEVDGLTYRITDFISFEVEVIGGTSVPTDLVLPQIVTFEDTDYTLVRVGNSAFQEVGLTSLTLPDTIRSIGAFAFDDNSLTDVILPEGLEIIGNRSFRSNSLSDLTIPSTVVSIGGNAFGFNPLTTVKASGTIPATIGENTFTGDVSDIDLTVPEGTEQVYLDADWVGFRTINGIFSVGFEFEDNGLSYRVTSEVPTEVEVIGGTSVPTDLVLPQIVTIQDIDYTLVRVGNSAFQEAGLTSVTLPATIRSIGAFAFDQNLLTDIVFPEGLEIIGNRSFRSNDLSAIIIPTTVVSIGESAFGSNPLTTVTALGITPASIGENTFTGDRSDIDLIVPEGTDDAYLDAGWTGFRTINGFFSEFEVNGLTYRATSFTPFEVIVLGGTSIPTDLVLPQTISFEDEDFTLVGVASSAFPGKSLTSVTLPNTIRSIGDNAFINNSFNTIEIPQSVETIGNSSFRRNNITAITIPSTVVSIGEGVFDENPLATITALGTIPATIEEDSFGARESIVLVIPENTETDYENAGWTGFFSVNGDGIAVGNMFSVGGIRYEILSLSPNTVKAIEKSEDVPNDDFIFPEILSINGLSFSIISIGESAFRFGGANSVSFPSTLTTIEFRAFRNNSNLTTVTIPANVTTISNEAFLENGLTEVISNALIPPSISNGTFGSRSDIHLTVPEGTIDAYLDAGWTGFASVTPSLVGSTFTIDGLTYRINSVVPNEVEVIGGTAVPTDLVLLQVIIFEDEEYTLVSVANNAFQLAGLTSVTLPNTLRSIGDFAFDDNALTTIEILEGVRTIGNRSFRRNNLSDITIPNTVVTIGESAFGANALATITALGITPATIEEFTFGGDRSDIDVFIPENTTQAYIDATWTGFNSITEITITITVAPKVFLQGASLNPITGEEDFMRDSLRNNGLLPTTSPYGDGATVNPTVFNTTGANAIVDWVLVELRQGVDNDNTTIVASASGFLQRDGDIVGLDGTSSITFTEDEGDYFIAIKHRNHIGVMAAVPAALSSAVSTLDFTQDAAFAKGENLALTEVNGTFAMIAGDADGSSNILNTDITEALTLSGGGEGYSTADADMNGFVLNSDIQLLVLANSGTVQQFE